jgi:hypothetical protein
LPLGPPRTRNAPGIRRVAAEKEQCRLRARNRCARGGGVSRRKQARYETRVHYHLDTRRGYPFHVPIEDDPTITGVVMTEQVKSIDFRAREARRISRAAPAVLDAVLSLLDACIY